MKKFYIFFAVVIVLLSSNLLAQTAPTFQIYNPSYDSWDWERGDQKMYMLYAQTNNADSVSFKISVDPGLAYVADYRFDYNLLECGFRSVENTPGEYTVVLKPIGKEKINYFNFNFILSALNLGDIKIAVRQFKAYYAAGYADYATDVELYVSIRDYVAKYYPLYFHSNRFHLFSLPSAEMGNDGSMTIADLFGSELYIWEWNIETSQYKLLGLDDKLRAGVAYWAYPIKPDNSSMFVLHEHHTKNCRVFSVRLQRGWNLVGGYYKTGFQPNEQTMPREATAVFGWESYDQGYYDVWGRYDMFPASGFWVASNGSAAMFFNGGVPNAPGSLGKIMGMDKPPDPPSLPTTTGVEETPVTPTEFALAQNYPNPFNPTTTIRFDLPHASDVSLVVYNTTGQVIKTLMSGQQSAGSHQVIWDGIDQQGQPVPSGVYFYNIKAGKYTASKKMMLTK